MRETVGSLRVYFIFLGIISGALNLFALLARPLSIGSMVSLAALALAIAFIYVGARLKVLLGASPKVVTGVVIASGAFGVFFLLLSLIFGRSIGAAFQAVIGILIAWYLYINVRRLSAATEAATSSA